MITYIEKTNFFSELNSNSVENRCDWLTREQYFLDYAAFRFATVNGMWTGTRDPEMSRPAV